MLSVGKIKKCTVRFTFAYMQNVERALHGVVFFFENLSGTMR